METSTADESSLFITPGPGLTATLRLVLPRGMRLENAAAIRCSSTLVRHTSITEQTQQVDRAPENLEPMFVE